MLILLLVWLSPAAHAAPQPIRVPLDLRTCTKSSECEAVPLRCGCCQYEGVSKLYVTDYLNQNPGCVDQPCHCQPLKLVPRCVKQRCELVNPAAKKHGKKKKVRPTR